MTDFRHLVDLNPRAGDSFWGLTRGQAKGLAWAVGAVGLLLADPPFNPVPGSQLNDLLNLGIATAIDPHFGLTFWIALLATYLVGVALVFLGFVIYPYDTRRLIGSFFKKLVRAAKRVPKTPAALTIAVLAVGIYLFFVYRYFVVHGTTITWPSWIREVVS